MPVVMVAAALVDRDQDLAPGNWREASQAAVGLAPDPAATPEAVVQVYNARTVRWRGYFGVHTWIAAKPTGADRFRVYEVLGWQVRRGGSAVAIRDRLPDARWYGNSPTLIAEQRGPHVDELIERIEVAVAAYPYADTYRIWPGPNSNTFIAHVLRAVPELSADLPPHAIGKDYLGDAFWAPLPSGSGLQFNLYGVLGLAAGLEEGLEFNLLGLTIGIDPEDLAIKLPMAGSLSARRLFSDARANDHT